MPKPRQLSQTWSSARPDCPARLAGVLTLLVEDEFEIADLFTFVLHEEGAQVIHAGSAEDALLVIEQRLPDILICNIKLPDRDGDWLIQQIRAGGLNHAIPAIAVTSYSREVCVQRALEAGFQEFLPKPIDPDELVDAVLRLLDHE